MTSPASVSRRRTHARRLMVALLVSAIVILIVRRDSDDGRAAPARPPVERLRVGTGASSALIVRPRGWSQRPAVIFLHGWRLVGENAYGAWIDHLVRRGSTVIVPRYQDRRGTSPAATLPAVQRGVRAALARLEQKPGNVVVAGHSAGGALAIDYAATAARARLPPAAAVLAIYPGRSIRAPDDLPAADPRGLREETRLIVMTSASDTLVGPGPGKAMLEAGGRVRDQRLIEVDDPVAGDHFSPATATVAARRVFWPVLDRLIDGDLPD